MIDKLRELTLLALDSHGCERLKDFYECGPVQRAAVETFLEAALSQQDAQAVPLDGWKMAPPTYGSEEVRKLRETIQSMARIIRDYESALTTQAQQDAQAVPLVTEQMIAAGQYAWMTADGVDPVRVFNAMLNAAPTPPAQRVTLTDDEIERLRVDQEFTEWRISEDLFLLVARAVIEAYEIKNGLKP